MLHVNLKKKVFWTVKCRLQRAKQKCIRSETSGISPRFKYLFVTSWIYMLHCNTLAFENISYTWNILFKEKNLLASPGGVYSLILLNIFCPPPPRKKRFTKLWNVAILQIYMIFVLIIFVLVLISSILIFAFKPLVKETAGSTLKREWLLLFCLQTFSFYN